MEPMDVVVLTVESPADERLLLSFGADRLVDVNRTGALVADVDLGD